MVVHDWPWRSIIPFAEFSWLWSSINQVWGFINQSGATSICLIMELHIWFMELHQSVMDRFCSSILYHGAPYLWNYGIYLRVSDELKRLDYRTEGTRGWSQYRYVVLPVYGSPMLKIRRSRDCFIFNTGISIPGKDGLYIETGPRMKARWQQWLPGYMPHQPRYNGTAL